LWLYELVYRRPDTDKIALWLITAATPIAAIAKTASGSPFYHNAGYQLHLNWAQWSSTTRYWIEGLLYLPYQSLTITGAVLAPLLPWAIAAAVRDPERRKPILLCAALVWILPLPVNFIDQRNFFAMYIPLAAWSVIASQSLVCARDWIVARVSVAPARARAGLAVAAVGLLYAAQRHDRFPRFEFIDASQAHIRTLASGVEQGCPALPPDAYVELRDDPFEKDVWDPVLITRLSNRREDISVHREPRASGNAPADRYDCTLAYREGGYASIR